ncbi:AAA+ ATPase domain-containing protein [Artemisia annua]|uniref:AAA+ ATPase domain-containing protein n=1 Tax=Artemisia annua TaxID=35608 RepID=A0A2U1KVN1_ARTAN|nr:AAA+ ATPase domain-containing protein [Artemisia annua]
MHTLLAVLPSGDGGLDDHVIYIDVESKCSSKRFIEIGMNDFSAISYMGAKPKRYSTCLTPFFYLIQIT